MVQTHCRLFDLLSRANDQLHMALKVLRCINRMKEGVLSQAQRIVVVCKMLRYIDEDAFESDYTPEFVDYYLSLFRCLISTEDFHYFFKTFL